MLKGEIMKTYLGVDVGMSGALSFYDGHELLIYDMPVVKRNKTKRVDCLELDKIISTYDCEHALIEQVNAFGMGATSAYNFGWSCATVEAIVVANRIPFTYITPQVWKKQMQCPKDKDAARVRASQLMPNHSHNWPLKKHDGRAESAILALMLYEKHNKGENK